MTKQFPIIKKDSAQLALNKTESLLKITDKILANRAGYALIHADAWLDELIAWANEFNLPDYNPNAERNTGFPRNKPEILSLQSLYFSLSSIKYFPESIGKLSNLTITSI